MKNKEILILGGGVAGSSLAYFLDLKGYKNVRIIEKNSAGPGGLSRTYKYAGHPYEFGPHIWFWSDDELNNHIRNLTNDRLYYIDRKLFSFVEKENTKYPYPIHFSSIKSMPDQDLIYKQLGINRDSNMKLIPSKLPTIGNCKFADYFTASLGENLYDKMMKDYTHKMWNIPGNKLETSMVWADRFKHAYENLTGYDPLKFENHTLGKGIKFQIYPQDGWSYVWDRMTKNACIEYDNIIKINKDKHHNYYLQTEKDKSYFFSDFKAVINTLDIDLLWGENTLQYTGRMIIPLLLPGIKNAFVENTESLHYCGKEFQTRVTEMKIITRHQSDDTLLLIEIPINSSINNTTFPENVINNALENNMFCKRAYPQQTQEMFNLYQKYKDKGNQIKNLFHCGRHAEFKYWGMPETVNSAYQLVKEKF